jgi:ribonuclease H / adenosylcobalamin/alpha-ribazole phosphatase
MGSHWTDASPTDLELILVRHAEHGDYGRRLTGRGRGGALSEAGLRQAAALGARLAEEGLAEIQTSPRERARDTAGAIALASGAGVTVADALDEIDFGDWTGAAFGALAGQPLWDAWNRARATARTPGGESMAEAAERIATHVSRLAAERAGERIVLVSHCDVIRALVATCLGLSLDNLLRFEIAPASVSRLRAGPWGACLVSLNETAATRGGGRP